MSGADGALVTVAGQESHFRAGSGGGAGATGGWGVGGGNGGGGGGGGASGESLGYPIENGGAGGRGGRGGFGGGGGLGGDGGGGGGGVMVMVHGFFSNGAVWEAKGGNGIAGGAGVAGTLGFTGLAGAAGGSPAVGYKGGNGGRGGDGGHGGRGGDGGDGASGAGGSIQVISAMHIDVGSTYDAGGGTGGVPGPAGLAQRHQFNTGSVNAPFGTFAAQNNPYRSYVQSLTPPIPPPPTLPVERTPVLPLFESGPASYGILGSAEYHLGQIISKLPPPPNCDAMVFRLDGADFFLDYADYDFLAVVNVRSGSTLQSPKIGAISPADTAQVSTPFTQVYQPAPQALLKDAGPLQDPAYFPAGTGPSAANPTYGQIWLTTIEKGKSFNVAAEWSPYGSARRIQGVPVRGTVINTGALPTGVIYLNDNGNPRATVELSGEYPATRDEGLVTSARTIDITRYVRQGTAPTFTFKINNSAGNTHSRMSGNIRCHGFLGNGGIYLGATQNFSNRAPGDAPVSVSVTAPTDGRELSTETLLANAFVEPHLDMYDRTSVIRINARIVGPYPYFQDSLTPMPAGDSLVGTSPGVGQTTPMVLNYANGDARPLAWITETSAMPNLTRLSILNVEIKGDASGAFSVAGSPTTTLAAGDSGSMTVNFTPPALGAFHATLRITTDMNATYGQTGQVFDIPLFGTTGDFHTWATALPAGKRGVDDDPNANGVANVIEYGLNGGGNGALPKPVTGGTGVTFDLPTSLRPDVAWGVEGSENLASWQRVATRNAATGAWTYEAPLGGMAEQLVSGVRRASLNMPSSLPHYYVRLAGTQVVNGYRNDFSSSAAATLLGAAVLDNGTLRLSQNGDAIAAGSAILADLQTWPGQSGFGAAFDLSIGMGSTATVADGVSFSAGNVGTALWGENGPVTSRNLTVTFDTYQNTSGGQLTARGIRLMVNGTMVAYHDTDPFTNGAYVPVVITYTPANGVTVKYNGVTVFSNVAVPGFTLDAGDRFGFGARIGGFNQVSRVDNVIIQPR